MVSFCASHPMLLLLFAFFYGIRFRLQKLMSFPIRSCRDGDEVMQRL